MRRYLLPGISSNENILFTCFFFALTPNTFRLAVSSWFAETSRPEFGISFIAGKFISRAAQIIIKMGNIIYTSSICEFHSIKVRKFFFGFQVKEADLVILIRAPCKQIQRGVF